MKTKTWQEKFVRAWGEEKHLSDYYVNDVKQHLQPYNSKQEKKLLGRWRVK